MEGGWKRWFISRQRDSGFSPPPRGKRSRHNANTNDFSSVMGWECSRATINNYSTTSRNRPFHFSGKSFVFPLLSRRSLRHLSTNPGLAFERSSLDEDLRRLRRLRFARTNVFVLRLCEEREKEKIRAKVAGRVSAWCRENEDLVLLKSGEEGFDFIKKYIYEELCATGGKRI